MIMTFFCASFYEETRYPAVERRNLFNNAYKVFVSYVDPYHFSSGNMFAKRILVNILNSSGYWKPSPDGSRLCLDIDSSSLLDLKALRDSDYGSDEDSGDSLSKLFVNTPFESIFRSKRNSQSDHATVTKPAESSIKSNKLATIKPWIITNIIKTELHTDTIESSDDRSNEKSSNEKIEGKFSENEDEDETMSSTNEDGDLHGSKGLELEYTPTDFRLILNNLASINTSALSRIEVAKSIYGVQSTEGNKDGDISETIKLEKGEKANDKDSAIPKSFTSSNSFFGNKTNEDKVKIEGEEDLRAQRTKDLGIRKLDWKGSDVEANAPPIFSKNSSFLKEHKKELPVVDLTSRHDPPTKVQDKSLDSNKKYNFYKTINLCSDEEDEGDSKGISNKIKTEEVRTSFCVIPKPPENSSSVNQALNLPKVVHLVKVGDRGTVPPSKVSNAVKSIRGSNVHRAEKVEYICYDTFEISSDEEEESSDPKAQPISASEQDIKEIEIKEEIEDDTEVPQKSNIVESISQTIPNVVTPTCISKEPQAEVVKEDIPGKKSCTAGVRLEDSMTTTDSQTSKTLDILEDKEQPQEHTAIARSLSKNSVDQQKLQELEPLGLLEETILNGEPRCPAPSIKYLGSRKDCLEKAINECVSLNTKSDAPSTSCSEKTKGSPGNENIVVDFRKSATPSILRDTHQDPTSESDAVRPNTPTTDEVNVDVLEFTKEPGTSNIPDSQEKSTPIPEVSIPVRMNSGSTRAPLRRTEDSKTLLKRRGGCGAPFINQNSQGKSQIPSGLSHDVESPSEFNTAELKSRNESKNLPEQAKAYHNFEEYSIQDSTVSNEADSHIIDPVVPTKCLKDKISVFEPKPISSQEEPTEFHQVLHEMEIILELNDTDNFRKSVKSIENDRMTDLIPESSEGHENLLWDLLEKPTTPPQVKSKTVLDTFDPMVARESGEEANITLHVSQCKDEFKPSSTSGVLNDFGIGAEATAEDPGDVNIVSDASKSSREPKDCSNDSTVVTASELKTTVTLEDANISQSKEEAEKTSLRNLEGAESPPSKPAEDSVEVTQALHENETAFEHLKEQLVAEKIVVNVPESEEQNDDPQEDPTTASQELHNPEIIPAALIVDMPQLAQKSEEPNSLMFSRVINEIEVVHLPDTAFPEAQPKAQADAEGEVEVTESEVVEVADSVQYTKADSPLVLPVINEIEIVHQSEPQEDAKTNDEVSKSREEQLVSEVRDSQRESTEIPQMLNEIEIVHEPEIPTEVKVTSVEDSQEELDIIQRALNDIEIFEPDVSKLEAPRKVASVQGSPVLNEIEFVYEPDIPLPEAPTEGEVDIKSDVEVPESGAEESAQVEITSVRDTALPVAPTDAQKELTIDVRVQESGEDTEVVSFLASPGESTESKSTPAEENISDGVELPEQTVASIKNSHEGSNTALAQAQKECEEKEKMVYTSESKKDERESIEYRPSQVLHEMETIVKQDLSSQEETPTGAKEILDNGVDLNESKAKDAIGPVQYPQELTLVLPQWHTIALSSFPVAPTETATEKYDVEVPEPKAENAAPRVHGPQEESKVLLETNMVSTLDLPLPVVPKEAEEQATTAVHPPVSKTPQVSHEIEISPEPDSANKEERPIEAQDANCGVDFLKLKVGCEIASVHESPELRIIPLVAHEIEVSSEQGILYPKKESVSEFIERMLKKKEMEARISEESLASYPEGTSTPYDLCEVSVFPFKGVLPKKISETTSSIGISSCGRKSEDINNYPSRNSTQMPSSSGHTVFSDIIRREKVSEFLEKPTQRNYDLKLKQVLHDVENSYQIAISQQSGPNTKAESGNEDVLSFDHYYQQDENIIEAPIIEIVTNDCDRPEDLKEVTIDNSMDTQVGVSFLGSASYSQSIITKPNTMDRENPSCDSHDVIGNLNKAMSAVQKPKRNTSTSPVKKIEPWFRPSESSPIKSYLPGKQAEEKTEKPKENMVILPKQDIKTAQEIHEANINMLILASVSLNEEPLEVRVEENYELNSQPQEKLLEQMEAFRHRSIFDSDTSSKPTNAPRSSRVRGVGEGFEIECSSDLNEDSRSSVEVSDAGLIIDTGSDDSLPLNERFNRGKKKLDLRKKTMKTGKAIDKKPKATKGRKAVKGTNVKSTNPRVYKKKEKLTVDNNSVEVKQPISQPNHFMHFKKVILAKSAVVSEMNLFKDESRLTTEIVATSNLNQVEIVTGTDKSNLDKAKTTRKQSQKQGTVKSESKTITNKAPRENRRSSTRLSLSFESIGKIENNIVNPAIQSKEESSEFSRIEEERLEETALEDNSLKVEKVTTPKRIANRNCNAGEAKKSSARKYDPKEVDEETYALTKTPTASNKIGNRNVEKRSSTRKTLVKKIDEACVGLEEPSSSSKTTGNQQRKSEDFESTPTFTEAKKKPGRKRSSKIVKEESVQDHTSTNAKRNCQQKNSGSFEENMEKGKNKSDDETKKKSGRKPSKKNQEKSLQDDKDIKNQEDKITNENQTDDEAKKKLGKESAEEKSGGCEEPILKSESKETNKNKTNKEPIRRSSGRRSLSKEIGEVSGTSNAIIDLNQGTLDNGKDVAIELDAEEADSKKRLRSYTERARHEGKISKFENDHSKQEEKNITTTTKEKERSPKHLRTDQKFDGIKATSNASENRKQGILENFEESASVLDAEGTNFKERLEENISKLENKQSNEKEKNKTTNAKDKQKERSPQPSRSDHKLQKIEELKSEHEQNMDTSAKDLVSAQESDEGSNNSEQTERKTRRKSTSVFVLMQQKIEDNVTNIGDGNEVPSPEKEKPVGEKCQTKEVEKFNEVSNEKTEKLDCEKEERLTVGEKIESSDMKYKEKPAEKEDSRIKDIINDVEHLKKPQETKEIETVHESSEVEQEKEPEETKEIIIEDKILENTPGLVSHKTSADDSKMEIQEKLDDPCRKDMLERETHELEENGESNIDECKKSRRRKLQQNEGEGKRIKVDGVSKPDNKADVTHGKKAPLMNEISDKQEIEIKKFEKVLVEVIDKQAFMAEVCDSGDETIKSAADSHKEYPVLDSISNDLSQVSIDEIDQENDKVIDFPELESEGNYNSVDTDVCPINDQRIEVSKNSEISKIENKEEAIKQVKGSTENVVAGDLDENDLGKAILTKAKRSPIEEEELIRVNEIRSIYDGISRYQIHSHDLTDHRKAIGNEIPRVQIEAIAKEVIEKIVGPGTIRMEIGNKSYRITASSDSTNERTNPIEIVEEDCEENDERPVRVRTPAELKEYSAPLDEEKSGGSCVSCCEEKEDKNVNNKPSFSIEKILESTPINRTNLHQASCFANQAPGTTVPPATIVAPSISAAPSTSTAPPTNGTFFNFATPRGKPCRKRNKNRIENPKVTVEAVFQLGEYGHCEKFVGRGMNHFAGPVIPFETHSIFQRHGTYQPLIRPERPQIYDSTVNVIPINSYVIPDPTATTRRGRPRGRGRGRGVGRTQPIFSPTRFESAGFLQTRFPQPASFQPAFWPNPVRPAQVRATRTYERKRKDQSKNVVILNDTQINIPPENTNEPVAGSSRSQQGPRRVEVVPQPNPVHREINHFDNEIGIGNDKSQTAVAGESTIREEECSQPISRAREKLPISVESVVTLIREAKHREPASFQHEIKKTASIQTYKTSIMDKLKQKRQVVGVSEPVMNNRDDFFGLAEPGFVDSRSQVDGADLTCGDVQTGALGAAGIPQDLETQNRLKFPVVVQPSYQKPGVSQNHENPHTPEVSSVKSSYQYSEVHHDPTIPSNLNVPMGVESSQQSRVPQVQETPNTSFEPSTQQSRLSQDTQMEDPVVLNPPFQHSVEISSKPNIPVVVGLPFQQSGALHDKNIHNTIVESSFQPSKFDHGQNIHKLEDHVDVQTHFEQSTARQDHEIPNKLDVPMFVGPPLQQSEVRQDQEIHNVLEVPLVGKPSFQQSGVCQDKDIHDKLEVPEPSFLSESSEQDAAKFITSDQVAETTALLKNLVEVQKQLPSMQPSTSKIEEPSLKHDKQVVEIAESDILNEGVLELVEPRLIHSKLPPEEPKLELDAPVVSSSGQEVHDMQTVPQVAKFPFDEHAYGQDTSRIGEVAEQPLTDPKEMTVIDQAMGFLGPLWQGSESAGHTVAESKTQEEGQPSSCKAEEFLDNDESIITLIEDFFTTSFYMEEVVDASGIDESSVNSTNKAQSTEEDQGDIEDEQKTIYNTSFTTSLSFGDNLMTECKYFERDYSPEQVPATPDDIFSNVDESLEAPSDFSTSYPHHNHYASGTLENDASNSERTTCATPSEASTCSEDVQITMKTVRGLRKRKRSSSVAEQNSSKIFCRRLARTSPRLYATRPKASKDNVPKRATDPYEFTSDRDTFEDDSSIPNSSVGRQSLTATPLGDIFSGVDDSATNSETQSIRSISNGYFGRDFSKNLVPASLTDDFFGNVVESCDEASLMPENFTDTSDIDGRSSARSSHLAPSDILAETPNVSPVPPEFVEEVPPGKTNSRSQTSKDSCQRVEGVPARQDASQKKGEAPNEPGTKKEDNKDEIDANELETDIKTPGGNTEQVNRNVYDKIKEKAAKVNYCESSDDDEPKKKKKRKKAKKPNTRSKKSGSSVENSNQTPSATPPSEHLDESASLHELMEPEIKSRKIDEPIDEYPSNYRNPSPESPELDDRTVPESPSSLRTEEYIPRRNLRSDSGKGAYKSCSDLERAKQGWSSRSEEILRNARSGVTTERAQPYHERRESRSRSSRSSAHQYGDQSSPRQYSDRAESNANRPSNSNSGGRGMNEANNYKDSQTNGSDRGISGDPLRTKGGSSSSGSRAGNGRAGNGGQTRSEMPKRAGNKLRKTNWNVRDLIPSRKDLYEPHPAVASRSMDEVSQYRRSNQLTVDGPRVPNPIQHLSETSFPDYLMDEIRKRGYNAPTAIQAQSWPVAMSGRDLLGIARKGSGKTLAYILPAIVHIKNQQRVLRGEGPIALILAPTRELAQQIQQAVSDFGTKSNVRKACMFGNPQKGYHARDLERGVEIVIGSPERLAYLLEKDTTNLKRCTYLVLDEVDRMFDKGWEPQIRKIIDQIRPDTQVLLWSATCPESVKKLAEDYMNEYIQIRIGHLQSSANPHTIKFGGVGQQHGKPEKPLRRNTVARHQNSEVTRRSQDNRQKPKDDLGTSGDNKDGNWGLYDILNKINPIESDPYKNITLKKTKKEEERWPCV